MVDRSFPLPGTGVGEVTASGTSERLKTSSEPGLLPAMLFR
jgi:hypothetical protein